MKLKHLSYAFFVSIVCGACTRVAQLPPVDYVDPTIGSGFHGHTYPGATVPFGAVQLSPDTRAGDWDACGGYHYSDSTLAGFSHTHLSGTGCIDLGDILFRPTTQAVEEERALVQPAPFSHEDETASAGYYAVTLRDEGIRAELTATPHAGLHRYTFPTGKTATVIVDLEHLLDNETICEASLRKTANNELAGMRMTRGWTDNQYIYFVAQFSKSMDTVRFVHDGRVALATFGENGNSPVIAKVGLSIVSEENARRNLEEEVEGFDFDAVHHAARAAWEQALGAITVEGGKDYDLKCFYTALYHAMVVPNVVSDTNGEYRRHDMTTGQVPEGQKRYSTLSLWDTFRAWHPLMTLTDTTLVNNIVNSLLDIYDTTGELPIWPLSAGETGTMIGYHAVSVIADAYMKGIRGYDAERALEAMVASSEKNAKGVDYYIRQGFIPSDTKRESVSCLLEFAYDDWCIARMAEAMGKEEIRQRYIDRSQSYVNVFDGQTRFFRPRRADGNWESPFHPAEVGRAYTEATAWQYRFFVPHDVNGIVQLFGGREAFVQALDSLFTAEQTVEGNLPDITGLVGQYAHGNEPSHHMAYLYDYVGQPWKTQEMTRRLLREMYKPSPEGIVGNEDCGQMSAWYVFTALGFYPVCPASNEFALTTPFFPKATIRLANGKRLTVTADNPGKNTYISKVELNGKEIETNYVTYEQLMEGGELRFTLTDRPDKSRGTTEEASPYSYTREAVVSVPYVDKDLHLFRDEIEVSFGTATRDACLRYTTDGSEPTSDSPLYTAPLCLRETTQLKVKGFKEGCRPSRTLSIYATKAELREPLSVRPTMNGTSYRYYEGMFQTVSDLEKTTPKETGIMVEPSIRAAKQDDHFGYLFSGLIVVPEDGVYMFQTFSDDGSVLYIGEEIVVNNDGSHAALSATGFIALEKGIHPYRLCYFEDYEGETLSWAWKLPSEEEFVPIPASALFVK